jgi:hypothetical protein
VADVTSIPAALRKLSRFLPLRPGTKQPAIPHAVLDSGQPWTTDTDKWLQSAPGMRVGIFMGGIYVVLDADVKRAWEDDGTGTMQNVLTHDGKDNLARLLAACGLEKLPRTVVIRTQGGGTHWYFLQNPECHVQQKRIGFLDIKAAPNGYCAIGAGYEVIDDGGGEVAVLPLELARILASPPSGVLEQATWNGHREGTYGNKQTAFNNALTAIKGYIVQQGFTEDEANHAVRRINEVVEEPMDEARLEGTVLKHKDWEPGEMVTDDVYAWALQQLGLRTTDDLSYVDVGTVKRLWTTEQWKLQQQVRRATAELERLEIMTGAEAADETPLPWMLRDILPESGTGAIIGGRGSYKTTLSLILAAAVQRGTMCLGRIATQGQVVFAAGEAWEYTSRMIPKIPGCEDVMFTKGRFGLSIETAPRFCERLLDIMERPSMIVFDTLSRFHIGKENDPTDMLRVWDGADYVARELGAFVFIIAHTGHQGEQVRGASSWGQAFNTEIFTDGSVLRFNKQRGIAQPADINIMYSFSDTLIKVEEGIDLARRAQAINQNYRRICGQLEKNPDCSTEKAYEIIQSVLKCSRTEASQVLRTLEDDNLIERIPGSGRKPAQISVIST